MRVKAKKTREELFGEMLSKVMDIVRKYEEKLSDYMPYWNFKNQLEATLKSMRG